jgi:acetoacetyl-CoA synthetase
MEAYNHCLKLLYFLDILQNTRMFVMDLMPVWVPEKNKRTNLDDFCDFSGLSFSSYTAFHQWSVEHLETFWADVADFFKVKFHKSPSNIRSNAAMFWETTWFNGATLNFAENILHHQDQRIAIIAYDEQGKTQTLSFADFRKQVAIYAHMLKAAGVKKGHRVVAVLPNTPHAIIAMLATASLGAIWASCSPEFGEMALIDRFAQIEPSCIFAIKKHRYAGKEFLNSEKISNVVDAIPSLQTVIWVDDLQELALIDDLTYEPVEFNHPLCVLFSSGTTGKPKCIVHRTGGVLLQHLKELGLHANLSANDRLLFYTTCGWMMWNWMLSALSLGTSLVLYDGSPMYPSDKRLLDVVTDSKTTVLGASAAYFANLEKNSLDYPSQLLSDLRLILSTGSPLLPAQYDFIDKLMGRQIQISSISGGSDIISCFALGHPQLPVYRGELQCLGLGMDVDIFNEQGQSIQGIQGELVCKKPFPSMPIGFWNDAGNQRYQEAYFQKYPNVWAHGDFAELTAHGGLIIYGRSDATLNPQGVRFGTAELYQVVLQVPGILDCIAVGQDWDKDTRVILFVQMREDCHWSDEVRKQLVKQIRQQLSPRHVPAKILPVRGIPKTINGKVMETAVRKLIHGQTLDNLAVIVNPECLEDYLHREELGMD